MNQRLQHKQVEQTGQTQQTAGTQRREFAEAEEVIRADREQTQPPESLGARLAQSIAGEPAPPSRPWWKRLFG
ncbi:MAG: hypothetical protein DVB31_01315 [Verrucomicrobia bacterium]|nr:MAG: hypothetical protein DVB31_01315 [Verrucomicrobiota bacterium]